MKKELKDWLPEIWVDIEGYVGLYAISNWGKVRSFDRKALCRNKTFRKIKAKILKMPLAGNGYPSVLLYDKKGISTRFLIHRLVGKYFIDNPDNLPEINHLFGNKLDNYFEHLAWSTTKDNINHAFDTGLNIKVQKNDSYRSVPVIRMDFFGMKLQTYPSQSEAARQMKVSPSNINHAIKHKTICNGYYWENN